MSRFSNFLDLKLPLQIFITSVTTILVVAGIAGATTIGTNISTGGSLTVTGTTTIDGSTFYVDAVNNRVGIGTIIPDTQLHVYGDTTLKSLADEDMPLMVRKSNDNNIIGGFRQEQGGYGSLFLYDGITNDMLNPQINLSATSSRPTFFNVGNVGIGTTTPQYKLDVDGDVGISGDFMFGGYKLIDVVSNTTNGNTTFGINIGEMLGGGVSNAFFGNRAGAFSTFGSNNAFFGSNTGSNNTTGSFNVFQGSSAGEYNEEGSRNIAIGTEAMDRNTDGDGNIAIGYRAGSGTGSTGIREGNVFLGQYAGYNETGSNKLHITNSLSTATSSLIYGEFDNNILSFNANVGIGTTTPDQALTIDHGNLMFAGVMYPRIFLHDVASRLSVDHFDPTIADLSLDLFGNSSGSNGNRGLNVYKADGTFSRISGTQDSFIMNGNLGVGTTTPEANLQVSGGSFATSTVEIGTTNATKGSCLKLRDSDGAGWTYCSTLNGVMSCSTTSCE